jgi:menaquinol-cytochrome c reductase cytochrome b/c subunit
MNQAEKEQYLRDYAILKSKGKPFFPYAVAKDSVMAAIVLITIVALSIIFGAELGPKADPTTTTYVPRPEWYFFFAFELLRVVKPPELVFMAAVGIPGIAMALLILLPFFDLGPERHPLKRPVAMTAMLITFAGMAFLTIEGAIAGSPTEIESTTSAEHEEGKAITAASGCLGCHKFGHNGGTLGPDLTHIADRLPKQAIARTLVNPTAPMPSYRQLAEDNPESFEKMVDYLGTLRSTASGH